jgi:hypothetical protein
MTLILTLMRPGEGIWQTVDARVTAGRKPRDNFASKQLNVHRRDGTLLLAYTGLAEIHPSGESMFDWLRGTLRGGNRSTEGDLLHLQERLNRDVARSRYSREPLLLIAAAVLGSRVDLDAPLQNRRMARWVLTNLIWPNGPSQPSKVMPAFELVGEWVDEPCGWSAGSGRHPVDQSPSDMAFLRRALSHRPNKPMDYLGLLGAINRRAAPRSRGTVSPWCSGTYMPELGQALRSRVFSKRGDPESPEPSGLGSILFGIDLTDSTRLVELQLWNYKRGLPLPSPFDFKRSVAPRP